MRGRREERLRESSSRMERSPKGTLEKLLEQAPSDLKSLKEDIESINTETPWSIIKSHWEEAGHNIEWFKEMGEELINKGIKMRRDGIPKQGGKKIWTGIAVLTTGLNLYERIIRSGERVKGVTEEIRTQKEKQKKELGEYLRKVLYLLLKAEIWGYKDTPSSEIEKIEKQGIRLKEKMIRGKLKELEKSLAETKEKRRGVPGVPKELDKQIEEELNRQIKKWREELEKQIH